MVIGRCEVKEGKDSEAIPTSWVVTAHTVEVARRLLLQDIASFDVYQVAI